MNRPQPPSRSPSSPPATPAAVWSLVLGILSILWFGPLAGVPAIICGHLARAKIRENPRGFSGQGMAVAGLIMGYLTTALTALILLVQGGLMTAGEFIYSLF